MRLTTEFNGQQIAQDRRDIAFAKQVYNTAHKVLASKRAKARQAARRSRRANRVR